MLNRVYGGHSVIIMLADALCTPAWSIAAGVTMVIHVTLTLNSRKSMTPEQAPWYGTVEEERDFAGSAVFYGSEFNKLE